MSYGFSVAERYRSAASIVAKILRGTKTVDIPVDLPQSTAPAQVRPTHPIYLTVRADRSVLIGDSRVERGQLAAALDRASGSDKEQRVYVRADKAVAYGELMEAMNDLRTAGYFKIALVGLEVGTTK